MAGPEQQERSAAAPPRPALRAGWMIAAGVTCLLAFVGAGGLVALHGLRSIARPSGIVVDDEEMAATRKALNDVLPEVAGLGPVTGRAGEPATLIDTCSMDSGDVFQPRVRRVWHPEAGDGRAIEKELAGQLMAEGWSLRAPASGVNGPEFRLRRGDARYRATVSYLPGLHGDPAMLHLGVLVEGREPCTLE